MWSLWRSHDVFESGTKLERGDDGLDRPAADSRALPDGEIAVGTPIPAVVPMPALPMAPVPPEVRIAVAPPPCDGPAARRTRPRRSRSSRRVELVHPERDAGKNPGYPFFIPGVAGHRRTQPPLDFARDPAGPAARRRPAPPRRADGKIGSAELYHQENI